MQDTINVYRYNQLISYLTESSHMHCSYSRSIYVCSYLALAGIEMSQYSTALNNFHFQHHSDTHNSERLSHSSRTRNPKSTKIENQQKNLETQLLIALLLCKMRYLEKTSMRMTLSTCNCT